MKSKAFEPWRPEHRASFVSACTGGQWPQVRQAACKAWTDDPSCQLCKSEAGTLLHRRYCVVTMPTGGWPLPSGDAAKFMSTIDVERTRVALTCGFLLARVIVRPAPVTSDFEWLLPPTDPIPSSATWYIDGSLTHPLLKVASRTGFGVVVVAYEGTLLAYGHGHPPEWVTDAAGAEAWAFFHVVSCNLPCPHVVTDCANILKLLELGHKAATDASRPLARVSGLIFSALDSCDTSSLPNRLVIWMPAHCTTAAIGNRIKSDGKFVSGIDWRANRLVDRLAKLAATMHCVPDAAAKVARSAALAAEYFAASVGTITFAANNHKVDETRADGSTHTVTLRDTMSASYTRRATKRDFSSAATAAPPASVSACTVLAPVVVQSAPKGAPTAKARKLAHTRAAQCHFEQQRETAFWSSFYERLGKRPVSSQSKPSASDRLTAISRKLLARDPSMVT